MNHRRLSLVVAFTITSTSLGLLAQEQYDPKGKLPIINRTGAFQVTSVSRGQRERPGAELLFLSLKNGYDKSVNCFRVSLGGGKTIQTDLIDFWTTAVIAPGATYGTDYRVQDINAAEGLTILAVMFEDGTGDGDPLVIKEIQNERAEERAQLSRVSALLQSAIDAPIELMTSTLNKLESEFSSLPEYPEVESPTPAQERMRRRKGILLEGIPGLRKTQAHPGFGSVSVRYTLIHQKTRCDQLRAKLRVPDNASCDNRRK